MASPDVPWKRFSGARRIAAELKALQRSPLASGNAPQVSHVTMVNDDLFRWRFRVKNFDEDVPSGKQLNRDLQELNRQYGQDHLLIEVQFPQDYPTHPFFLRVVSPRCVMYSGHVTAGGSVCIEALVATGGPRGWRPDYCVEGLLVLVLDNMLHAEVAVVRTPTGPGGMAGPLRVDLSRGRYCLSEYSQVEAHAAYDRTVSNHGWAGRSGGPGAAAAAGSGAGGSGMPPPVPLGQQLGAAAMASAPPRVPRLAPPPPPAAAGPSVPIAARAATRPLAVDTPASRTRSRTRPQPPPAGQAAAQAAPGTSAGGSAAGRGTGRRGAAAAAAAPSAAAAAAAAMPAPAAPAAAAVNLSAAAVPVPAARPAAPAAPPTLPPAGIVQILDSDDDQVSGSDDDQVYGSDDDELLDSDGDDVVLVSASSGGGGAPASPRSLLARAQPQRAQVAGGSGAGPSNPALAAAAAAAAAAVAAPGSGMAAAARPQLTGQKRPGVAAAAAYGKDVICILDDDDDDDDEDVQSAFAVAAAPGTRKRQRIQQQQQQQQPAHPGAAAAAAAAASAGAASQVETVDLTNPAGLLLQPPANAGPSASPRFRQAADKKPGAAVTAAAAAAAPVGFVASGAAGVAVAVGSGGAAVERLAADAAMAAMWEQLEAAKAKAEEERRARERLEAKLQEMAAKTLLAGAGPSGSGAGPSGGGSGGGGAGPSNVLLSAPPPAHWEPMREEEGFGVKLVVLPLPGGASDQRGGCSSVAAPGSGSLFAPATLSASALSELQANGLSRADATHLLRHCNGNLDEAMRLAVEAAEYGGIKALLRRQQQGAAASAAVGSDGAAGAAAAKAAREAVLQQELERVLARFEKASGLSRSRVVRVERVQNWRLWTKYCIRRREVEALVRQASSSGQPSGGASPALNEFYMWHGTPKAVVQTIVTDGFDLRVSNRACALGEGVYFAANANYSVAYSNKPAIGMPIPNSFGAPVVMPPTMGLMGGVMAMAGAWMGGAAGTGAVANTAPAAGATTTSQAFPGKQGAMMLCRVTMGRMAMGQAGMRKPPQGADSVFMIGSLQPTAQAQPKPRTRQGARKAAAAAGSAAAAGAAAAEASADELAAWNVGSVLGPNLIVAVFDNAQAYPEYIVHFD